MSDHLHRITIDIDASVPASEFDGIIASVFHSLSRCWADTTTGPINDGEGNHVANAKVAKIPLSLQLAHEVERHPDPLLAEAREVIFRLVHQIDHVRLGQSLAPKVDTADAEAELAALTDTARALLAKMEADHD